MQGLGAWRGVWDGSSADPHSAMDCELCQKTNDIVVTKGMGTTVTSSKTMQNKTCAESAHTLTWSMQAPVQNSHAISHAKNPICRLTLCLRGEWLCWRYRDEGSCLLCCHHCCPGCLLLDLVLPPPSPGSRAIEKEVRIAFS